MSEKTPQPGEFWEKENVRLRVIGSKRNGVFVGEHECGSIALFVSHHDWRHLPDCTGFDWQPETFPQWYVRDEFRWITKQGECSSWFSAHEGSVPASHGHIDQFGSRLEIRCRRKDLPSLPNKFATLANEIEQLRADMMRRCDELGVKLTELEEGGNG